MCFFMILAAERELGSSSSRAGEMSSIIFADEKFMQAICYLAFAELESRLPECKVAPGATGLSVGCWEGALKFVFDPNTRSLRSPQTQICSQ